MDHFQIDFRTGYLQHSTNIPQVLVTSTLPEKLQFPKQDIFRRCDPDLDSPHRPAPSILQRPGEVRVISGGIKIRLQAAAGMDDIKMAPVWPGDFDFENIQRRTIVFRIGEDSRQISDLTTPN
jgi:hypothetical protein